MSAVAAPAGFSRLLSDERLTRRAVRGDERAFAAIFRRYHQDLYRFCLAIVGNSEDAQDALQNAMMKVLRALPGEERRIELKPWLYRIAHNESVDLLRRRRETRQLDAGQAAPGHSLAEDAETRERLRLLLADLGELPERQREVLVMRELSGFGFEEIGAALDTTGAVARQTLYEARLSLRQMEEGREMSCDEVTRALSDGDGRVTRRRDVRAHLRTCAACRDFRDEIKGRQRDLAAISPLPAVAAAGMLQGLAGGSGAAGSGGLAATLGGGAAKTIAGSAAAKGVATAAVVAAVGVTAADRTGAIHVGLPGERGAKSSKAVPGSSEASPGAGASQGGSSGSVGSAAGGKAGAEQPAKGEAGGASPKEASGPAAADQGQEHGGGQGEDKGHGQGFEAPADPNAQNSPSAGVSGQGQEKQPPEAAAEGQEAAAGNKATPSESGDHGKAGDHGKGHGGGGDGSSGPPPKQSDPSTPESPGAPPKGPPENPPGAAPDPPGQSPPQSNPPEAPGNSAGKGKGKGLEKP